MSLSLNLTLGAYPSQQKALIIINKINSIQYINRLIACGIKYSVLAFKFPEDPVFSTRTLKNSHAKQIFVISSIF